jgi:hypothetical protein
MKYSTNQRGIALLITLLIMSVLLAVSSSLLNITLKQYQFSSIGLASEVSFQSANAGIECMLYHDYVNYPPTPGNPGKFDIGQNKPAIACMGANDSVGGSAVIASGAAQNFRFNWGSPAVCTDVSIYKFFELGTTDGNATGPDMSTALRRAGNCAEDVTCTVIQSRGYNTACASLNTPRVIEREIVQRY